MVGPERQPVRLVGLLEAACAWLWVAAPGVMDGVALCATTAIVNNSTNAVMRDAFFIAFLLIRNINQ